MKLRLFQIYIMTIFVFIACAKPNQKYDYKLIFDNMQSEFVEMRYDGKFRSDTLFSKKLDSLYKKSEQLKLTSLQDSILNIQIEWDLLQGNLEAAKRKIPNTKINSPNSPDYKWIRAYYNAAIKEYETAIKDIESIFQSDSLNDILYAKSYWLMASIQESQKSDSLAMQYYDLATQNLPKENYADYYVEAIVHLGNLYYTNKGELEKATELYTQGLKIAKDHQINRLIPACYYHLGKVKEKEGNLEQARILFEEGLVYASKLPKKGNFMLTLLNNKIQSIQSKK